MEVWKMMITFQMKDLQIGNLPSKLFGSAWHFKQGYTPNYLETMCVKNALSGHCSNMIQHIMIWSKEKNWPLYFPSPQF